MASKESLARAKKYNQRANICFCRTVPQESEKCYNCRSLADLLDEAIREARKDEAEWWAARSSTWMTEFRQRLAQLREGKT